MSADALDAATLIAGVATSLAVVTAWPQISRLRRTGDTAGVSLSMATLSIANEAGWVVYLSSVRLWSAIGESLLSLAIGAVLAVALLRAGSPWGRPCAGAVAWLCVLLAARVVGGPAAIGAILSISYGVQLAPAVWTAWRARRPTGISPASWTFCLVESGLWGIYGLLRADQPLVTLGVLGTIASLAILVRVALARGGTALDGARVAVR